MRAWVGFVVGGLWCAACAAPAPTATPHTTTLARASTTLTLLATADEHGWLLPSSKPKGTATDFVGGVELFAAALAGHKDRSSTLLLSAGDMWTGPFESTLQQGVPMVDAMNALAYDAAAVGNHEFDFGQTTLAQRQQAMRFSLLSANVVTQAGIPPPFAQPFVVVKRAGLRVGVVGLTTVSTPQTTDARFIEGLQFLPYDVALARAMPQVRQAGADIVVVLLHAPTAEARALLPLARRLGVQVMFSGHLHEQEIVVDDNATPVTTDDIVICNAGAWLRAYCEVKLTVAADGQATPTARIVPVVGPQVPTVDVVSPIVRAAEARAATEGNTVICTTKTPLRRGRRGELPQLVVDSWQAHVAGVAAAITNVGGIRQDIAAGEVRVRDVVSALPFANTLVRVPMTGTELRIALDNPSAVVAGVRRDGERLVDQQGRAIADDDRVWVVINGFMWRGGDGFAFAHRDEGEDTGIDWRVPVYKALAERSEAQ